MNVFIYIYKSERDHFQCKFLITMNLFCCTLQLTHCITGRIKSETFNSHSHWGSWFYGISNLAYIKMLLVAISIKKKKHKVPKWVSVTKCIYRIMLTLNFSIDEHYFNHNKLLHYQYSLLNSLSLLCLDFNPKGKIKRFLKPLCTSTFFVSLLCHAQHHLAKLPFIKPLGTL